MKEKIINENLPKKENRKMKINKRQGEINQLYTNEEE